MSCVLCTGRHYRFHVIFRCMQRGAEFLGDVRMCLNLILFSHTSAVQIADAGKNLMSACDRQDHAVDIVLCLLSWIN